MQYYENNVMKKSLVLEDAQNIVGKIVLKKTNNRGELVLDKDKSISSAQLRKFYNEFKSIEQTFQVHKEPSEAFANLLPKIKLNIAKVHYVRSRKLVPVAFSTWLEDCVKSIQSYEDFTAFMLHFEAIVGFAYGAGLND